MSPRLKPLLLPQLVQQRQTAADASFLTKTNLDQVDLRCAYPTANSSVSDINSPVTPVFSPRSAQQFSSSMSSLELPTQAQPECPSPPSLASSTQSSVRYLADVEEEPMQQREDDAESFSTDTDSFGLYSCLCDQACSHRNSVEADYQGDLVSEFDIDYDVGFLSDGDCIPDTCQGGKKRNAAETAFAEFASKLGSRMPTIRRWQTSKRATLRASPTTCLSLENVLSHGAWSSRSSSMSDSPNAANGSLEAMLPMSSETSVSPYGLGDDREVGLGIDLTAEDHSNLERDRSMATTPLLPPLAISALASPPRESPLQSPKIERSTAMEAPLSPALVGAGQSGRPPLSSRPSMSSLRKMSSSAELPLVLPTILQEQEHDEWSDRLGHANFTISPQPYELDGFGPEAIAKFRSDWDLARVNYTKHLVRTGENYGQTSKIYVLTEAKWAEIEGRWRTTLEGVIKNTCHSSPGSQAASRNQSRGRGRGRSSSSNTVSLARRPTQDELLAELEWRRVEDCLPSAVPQMLESLNVDGKFPGRGDEDIVGPMQRDAVMVRARSEDAKGRFWKAIADKVGLRK
ncbi:hypothetical protein E4U42_007903 [Claviceps africana]|uniref:Only prolin and serin are matching in the corresponding protein n=1 Tax=Claviceps africana TaxID=83212 RepID=A0A8K0J0K7_9HYPO|nr:hypothetical protein E4U42_007903 [Claviceps africana]